MVATIQESTERLHGALRDYIEATYHIGHEALIRERQQLLQQVGVTFQVPYIESTRRYVAGPKYSELPGLPAAALQAYETLATPAADGRSPLLFDPPYAHQAEAVEQVLVHDRSLVVTTGTGSGKTEAFLLPILGKLAREAAENPGAFATPAMRALVLYPMNALVNDQLSRLRGLFGDPRLVALFKSWAGRPARFARYTSRTPYPGVRTPEKDQSRLDAFENFFVEIERQARGDDEERGPRARALRQVLKDKGKWPAKHDLAAWFGEPGTRWKDGTGHFRRAVTLADDTELVTRHEAQANPPDLMITNYSMLEYMMVRPIERPIFDATRDWLASNTGENFLVVLDEAHLYRGAAGAEVGLLLRRLRDRLEIPPERFQVICATASFEDVAYAPIFGAQLSGVGAEHFVSITGKLAPRPGAAPGDAADTEALASVDLTLFYDDEASRSAAIQPLLAHRGVAPTESPESDLHSALAGFPPLALLVNRTMQSAVPVSELGTALFPEVDRATADRAASVLLSLGSAARDKPDGTGLLPCRVHSFFRGLPGLWACLDPACTEIAEANRNPICGRLYAQPRERCDCGARVLELFTCRHCGTAYARAYTDNPESPNALWSEPGRRLEMLDGSVGELLPLDMLLEGDEDTSAELAALDMETGRLNPSVTGPRMRSVHLRSDAALASNDDDEDGPATHPETRGQFMVCAACKQTAGFGRSPVQDHQTKGDQPFEALVSRQIGIQPPNPVPASHFAPLRGRKVLVFSDSRQVAARLAPNLQMYSVRDTLRALVPWGMRKLQASATLALNVSLEDLYCAVLLASSKFEVRLRPELGQGETFADERSDEAVRNGALEDDTELMSLRAELMSERPPAALLADISKTIRDPFLGLEALAIASLAERPNISAKLRALPSIPGVADTPDQKVALVRAWLRSWRKLGFWLNAMPGDWWNRSVKGHKDGALQAFTRMLPDKAARNIFSQKWLPELQKHFTDLVAGSKRRLKGSTLTLALGGEWVRCGKCRSVHRPVPTIPRCLDCGEDGPLALNPEADPVFLARKGYYRAPVMEALADPPVAPLAFIAAEHTAQLNAPQGDAVFSKAEEHELLFQDVALDWDGADAGKPAIDVLSSTTTMEVGIDIGALSGVALRNMPPGRANYQQRAGRAGRRGNAVATVVAFGSADSHDEHYFTDPDGMICGKVVDPKLALDNAAIARRHVLAYLVQAYHRFRLPTFGPGMKADLFSTLGKTEDFRSGTSVLNRRNFEEWITREADGLRDRIAGWLPCELRQADREALLGDLVPNALADLATAIGPVMEPTDTGAQEGVADEQEENPPQVGDERKPRAARSDALLDQLLYHGVLPRYAFPTDVASFTVFDQGRSSRFRQVSAYAPSQSLPVALSQYAPGKQVWIAGKCYTSGAIYSPVKDERAQAWKNRKRYLECDRCGFAETRGQDAAPEDTKPGECRACGHDGCFGPARSWLRPPGFAHPVDVPEATSPDDAPETSYATRAKLQMETPVDPACWTQVNERLGAMAVRDHLLVSNSGPRRDGYCYCTLCGRIEAEADPQAILAAPHRKPFVDDKEPVCPGGRSARHVVLGTDFITDIALFSFKVRDPLNLAPGTYPPTVALRSVSEAMARAACEMLEVEPGEVLAEFRPALTDAGRQGLEAEVFLYDTLPGGAGFASQLPARADELLHRTLKILGACPEGCDASCYRCLRSFRNRFDHALLDRHVGAALVRFVLTDQQQPFDARRLATATELLCRDLSRPNFLLSNTPTH